MPFNVIEKFDRTPESISSRLNPHNERIEQNRRKYIKWTDKKLFTEIGIETISRCNGKCSFCPVSIQNEKRPFSYMTDETWNKIIDELSDISFSGTILPYINNEIFLDKKIFDRLKYAREKLGESVKINFESNGKLLREKNDKGLKMIEKVSQFVDQILINDYADTEENYLNLNPRIRYLRDNINKIKTNRHIDLKIHHRLETQLLNNRFGMVDGFAKQKIPEKSFCDFPFFQFNINPEGDAFICCRDSYFQEKLGNINEMSILEIWKSKRYNEIRDAFLNDKRICDVCKVCTSAGSISI